MICDSERRVVREALLACEAADLIEYLVLIGRRLPSFGLDLTWTVGPMSTKGSDDRRT